MDFGIFTCESLNLIEIVSKLILAIYFALEHVYGERILKIKNAGPKWISSFLMVLLFRCLRVDRVCGLFPFFISVT